jgi:glycosyltransferase involved in cell wall biosynthesis
MQFTVVIPSYNRGVLIGATLCSVLEQTYFDFEVIVVDDGSTDNTREVVMPFLADPRIRYFKIENSERGAARNFGVSQSMGRYITFLDSDDIFLPWHLKTANEKVRTFHSPPAFHLGYEILHLNGEVNALPLLPSPVNDKLLEGNFLSCMGVFLRRDVALENPFDEDRRLSGSEDYELWMRIAARVPILTFPEVTSRLINHENRSVILTNVEKLVTRISFLGKKLQSDEMFIKRFGSQLNVFDSYRTLYLALHLAMSGKRWMALKSLFFTARSYAYVLFNYRFIVVIKKILLW